ncbi:MAG: phosphoenolpyruvate--protein phosphotransferase [Kiritimatiellae bacterium]|nr:phosphoenolpyruvate--protein phosphotransferase [Kiritimatiellia bacterium]
MSSSGSMQTLAGLATARGFVAGPAFIYHGDGDVPVPEYVIEPGREGDEVLRLERACNETRRDLEGLISALGDRAGHGAGVRVFESHLMMLDDPSLIGSAERLIRDERLNAEAAVRRTVDGARAQFQRMNDPYFRERVRDFDDLERRILGALTGIGGSTHLELKAPSVIIADDLTPSETVRLPREYVLGFAMNGGSTTSHVALLARSMGVPSVSGLGDVTERVKAGDTVLLDGTNGTVVINPDVSTVLQFRDLVERQKEITEEASLGAPAGTLRDGGEVSIFANFHAGVPMDDVRAHGARGIGLYRSEYLWLNRELQPTEEEQFAAYREAAEFASTLGPQSSLAIRVLDIGGDKMVRGISARESNPFLGNRSIRYLLSHRDVFRTQLRAILRASAFGRVRLMYPMISCVEELRESAEMLDEARKSLDSEGVAYDRDMLVGMMVEVPSAAINATAFAKMVDFFSIGTNDLVQYVMAADRGNDAVARLYQPTNPAVMKLMRLTIDAAKARGIPVSVCGVSAADPIVGILWAAMGVDELSVSATYIPVLSKLLHRLSRADLDEYAKVAESCGDDMTGEEVFAACRAWMAGKFPDLDNIVL